ncbi:MAG TPA: hypothetical protein VM864_03610 [Pyrinomonadaceae bacterium]|jgi:hypothetical protein|nr:hypothetical protein [Pyrinomonadaceae bacterium]
MNNTTAAPPAAQKKKRVPAGMWGGEHISMEVDDKAAAVEYDCGRGTINQPLVIDSRGEFDVKGEHIAEHGGPVRVGPSSDNKDSHPARYAGRIDGETMTLTVTMTDTQEEVGTFTLTHGKAARLVKCK